MRRFLAICGCGVAIGATVLPASAQTRVLDESQFMGRVGGFVPVDESLRDLADLWFAVGIDIEIPRGLAFGGSTVISVDWFTHSGGARDNAFPVLLNQRWYSGAWPQRTYIQGGIGVGFLDFQPADTVFAARVGVGIELNERMFVEASFYWTDDDASNVNASGLAGFVGVRF